MQNEFLAERLFFQKFDRIISRKWNISVDIAFTDFAFANLKDNSIHINFGKVANLTDSYEKFLISAKGFNLHELAHILWTARPKNFDYYWDFEKEKQLYNILEDSRIENLFIIDYPASKEYFEYNVANFIANMKNSPESVSELKSLTIAYLLTYPRKFFSPEFAISAKSRIQELFKSVSSEYHYAIQDVENLCDEYILTHNFSEQKPIILKLCIILKKLMEEQNLIKNQTDSLGIRDNSDGKPANDTKSNKYAEQKTDTIKKQTEEYSKKIQSNEKSQDVRTAIEEIKIKIKEKIAENINQDIKNIVEIRQKLGNDAGFEIYDSEPDQPFVIENKDNIMSRKIEIMINHLRNERGSGWKRKQKSGRVSFRDVIQNEKHCIPSVNLFRKFGKSKINRTKLGVIFLIDTSGSVTKANYELAIRMCYVVGKALEKTDSKVCIATFKNRQPDIIKNFSQNINSIKTQDNNRGGTDIIPSLIYAEEQFRKLTKAEIKNNLLIIVSDFIFSSKIENKTKEKYDLVRKGAEIANFCIEHTAHNTHSHFDKLAKHSNYSYAVNDYDELFRKVIEFIKTYEKKLHIAVERWN